MGVRRGVSEPSFSVCAPLQDGITRAYDSQDYLLENTYQVPTVCRPHIYTASFHLLDTEKGGLRGMQGLLGVRSGRCTQGFLTLKPVSWPPRDALPPTQSRGHHRSGRLSSAERWLLPRCERATRMVGALGRTLGGRRTFTFPGHVHFLGWPLNFFFFSSALPPHFSLR